MIAVVDYGARNIDSVLNMMRKVGGQAVASQAENLRNAQKVILPVVCRFNELMHKLDYMILNQLLF